MTSDQNCLTVFAMIGPRQTTGEHSSSNRRFTDMMSIPVFVRIGSSPCSEATACSCMPKALGMDGPVISASRMAACLPRRLIATASKEVTILLPTPPFPLTTPITFPILLSSCGATKKSAGFALREAQFSEQLPQSLLQPSLIRLTPSKLYFCIFQLKMHVSLFFTRK